MALILPRQLAIFCGLAMLPISNSSLIAQQWLSTPVVAAPLQSEPKVAASTDGFVLLSNQNILRGQAVQNGNEIVVTRSDGSQLHLNRQRVLCWGPAVQDLYRFRVDQRQANDLPAYLADIRWCLRHEQLDPQLLQTAKEDLRQAHRIAPRDPSLVRLAVQLHRQIAGRQSSQKAVVTLSQADRQAEADRIKLVDFQKQQLAESQELDRDTLVVFARDVQPMLINHCGGCHSQLSQRQWKLLVPAKGSRASARMTRENLLALGTYLNFAAGLESQLRLRAMDGHAGKRHTLGERETVATKTFDHWLQYAKPAGAALEIAKRELTSNPIETSPTSIQGIGEPTSLATDDEGTEVTGASPEAIERLPQVANPFDPEIFNRRQRLR